MTPSTANPVPRRQKFLDDNGNTSRIWIDFLNNLSETDVVVQRVTTEGQTIYAPMVAKDGLTLVYFVTIGPSMDTVAWDTLGDPTGAGAFVNAPAIPTNVGGATYAVVFFGNSDDGKWYWDSLVQSPGFVSPMTTLGDTLYGATAGAATRLAGNTTVTPKALMQTGTGTISAAPAWVDPTTICAAIGFPGAYASVALTGQTTSSGPTNIRHGGAVLPAGRYLLMVTAIVTATGTNNLTVTLAWNDGTAAESVALGPSGMGTSPGRLEIVQHVILNGSTDLTYTVTISGGAGGTASVWADVMRVI